MIRVAGLVLALALAARPAVGQREDWTTLDKIAVVVGGALIATDWSLTLGGVRQGLTEQNPALGFRPSEGRVNAWLGGGLLLYVAAALALPDVERRFLVALVIAAETYAVSRNLRLGVRLALP